jgi:hypothetical protein
VLGLELLIQPTPGTSHGTMIGPANPTTAKMKTAGFSPATV